MTEFDAFELWLMRERLSASDTHEGYCAPATVLLGDHLEELDRKADNKFLRELRAMGAANG